MTLPLMGGVAEEDIGSTTEETDGTPQVGEPEEYNCCCTSGEGCGWEGEPTGDPNDGSTNNRYS